MEIFNIYYASRASSAIKIILFGKIGVNNLQKVRKNSLK
jgi:hypothetical protein